MNDINKRAAETLHLAFCRLRYLSSRELTDSGKLHMFQVADSAHNIPLGLGGCNKHHGANMEFELDVLEQLLSQTPDHIAQNYLADTVPYQSTKHMKQGFLMCACKKIRGFFGRF